MKYIISFLIDFSISFVLIYLFYLLLVNRKTKKKRKINKINDNEMNIMISRYNLDINVIGEKKLKNIISLLNSFIFAFTITIMQYIDSFIYKILVCFVILMVLIYSLYEITGKYLKKHEKKIKSKKKDRDK